jgi:hypothetical protein
MRLNNRGSWSLVGLLVAVVIVIVVAAVMMGNSKNGPVPSTVGKNTGVLDSKSKKETVFGRSMDTAKATDCRERLNQIRMGIQTWKASEATEQNPRTLKDIGLGVGSDYYQCPMSNKPYTYDPATGIVKCPTHDDF